MATLVSGSGVAVLKGKLREKYASEKTRSFKPLPRSSVELQVDDVYAELLLTDKDEAIGFYKKSGGHNALFLPLDADHEDLWHALLFAGECVCFLATKPGHDFELCKAIIPLELVILRKQLVGVPAPPSTHAKLLPEQWVRQ